MPDDSDSDSILTFNGRKLFSLGGVMGEGVIAIGINVRGTVAIGVNALGSVLAIGVNSVGLISLGVVSVGAVCPFTLAAVIGREPGAAAICAVVAGLTTIYLGWLTRRCHRGYARKRDAVIEPDVLCTGEPAGGLDDLLATPDVVRTLSGTITSPGTALRSDRYKLLRARPFTVRLDSGEQLELTIAPELTNGTVALDFPPRRTMGRGDRIVVDVELELDHASSGDASPYRGHVSRSQTLFCRRYHDPRPLPRRDRTLVKVELVAHIASAAASALIAIGCFVWAML